MPAIPSSHMSLRLQLLWSRVPLRMYWYHQDRGLYLWVGSYHFKKQFHHNYQNTRGTRRVRDCCWSGYIYYNWWTKLQLIRLINYLTHQDANPWNSLPNLPPINDAAGFFLKDYCLALNKFLLILQDWNPLPL